MKDQTIVLALEFLLLLIGVGAPVLKLNTNITRLNTLLDNLEKSLRADIAELKGRVDKHGEELDDVRESVAIHKTKIEQLEKYHNVSG